MDRFELRLQDEFYPDQLRNAPDPPKVLYGVGDPEALRPGLAVIGARRATPYGLTVCRLLAGWAAAGGYVVISGGAVGCDQAAHRASLEHDGVTVAVMAGGADVPYPAAAAILLSRVRVRGAIVSEQPWGTRPTRWMFRKRNRIIAGLSAGVLVVEAGLPSGTFSTADDAVAAEREVLAVPGSIFAPEAAGSNRLIANGATVITDLTDLRIALSRTIGDPHREADRVRLAISRTPDDVLRAVSADAMRPEDVALALGIDTLAVLRRLGHLEAGGEVQRYHDGRYGATPHIEGLQ